MGRQIKPYGYTVVEMGDVHVGARIQERYA